MSSLAQHIVSSYDSDLDRLTISLSELGHLVEVMVSDAVLSLKTRNVELADDVIKRDAFANRLQAQIDTDTMRILALRSPMATDLRRTVGSIRVASDLERIGDLSEGIAKRSRYLTRYPAHNAVAGLARMGRQVRAQLSKALDAFLREDAAAAMQIWIADQEIDALYNGVLRDIVSEMATDPDTVEAATALLFTAKNLERIGDHTSNICEVIYFTQHGKQLIDDNAVQALLQTGHDDDTTDRAR